MLVCDSDYLLVDSRVDCMYVWKLRCGGVMLLGELKGFVGLQEQSFFLRGNV